MLFAFLIWGVTASKRSPEARKISGALLKDILRLCCETDGGWSVEFPAVFLDGHTEIRSQTIASDMIVDCWTPEMSQKIALLWDSAILDDKCPFPTSTRTRTTLSDYVLWSLEPVPLNHKDAILRDCKQVLAPSLLAFLKSAALLQVERAVVPQSIAQANDSARDTRFEVMAPKTTKRRRLDTVALNAVAARASEKLFTGQEFGRFGLCCKRVA